MFKKILIANRGEIALRVIRACREMGIKTVAVYSEADAQSLHVRAADESVCVGPADAAASYRNIPNILSAAEITDAEAIHPGYGFLAEDPNFAEVCASAGIKFIGPTPENIKLMGNKAKAREIVAKAGVPIIPGSQGVINDDREAQRLARKIGLPIIIKSANGGGGRGLRLVHTEVSLPNAFLTAQTESLAGFGSADVYIEKYLGESRHIEIQILADDRGRVVHLGERECSIQRRHQKLVEESPSPALTEKLRRRMGDAAVEVAKAVRYRNAGTVEFLLDGKMNYYFLEMNTRIQVEHPVTEMVTGLDLVKEQILIASGQPLRFKQRDISFRGHCVEVRVNAEHPEHFTPSPGEIAEFIPPGGPGIRVDTAIYSRYRVPSHYDSLLAKVLAYGQTREEAVSRMTRALDETVLTGVHTTIPLLQKIVQDPDFRRGKYTTSFVDRFVPRT
jgi:acetyl-CoA carboxylase biotin carboxylase subunit